MVLFVWNVHWDRDLDWDTPSLFEAFKTTLPPIQRHLPGLRTFLPGLSSKLCSHQAPGGLLFPDRPTLLTLWFSLLIRYPWGARGTDTDTRSRNHGGEGFFSFTPVTRLPPVLSNTWTPKSMLPTNPLPLASAWYIKVSLNAGTCIWTSQYRLLSRLISGEVARQDCYWVHLSDLTHCQVTINTLFWRRLLHSYQALPPRV